MSKKPILLISYDSFGDDFLEAIGRNIFLELKYPVLFEKREIEIEHFYNPERRQYDANKLLEDINSNSSDEYSKKLGLFRVDLYIPILTYIFGQAALGGRIGLVSLYRLRNEHYGLKADAGLLNTRYLKVILHELGHTFGLIHCHIPSCVMRSSTYVEDLDQKSHHFCRKCKNELITE